MFLWEMSGQAENPYLWMLGAATHLVTSGTISTTSDLLATGKPVYYTDMEPLCSEDRELKNKLMAGKVVGHFDAKMLNRAPPSPKIRHKYQESWGKISEKFYDDLNALLVRRNIEAALSLKAEKKRIANLLEQEKKFEKKITKQLAAFAKSEPTKKLVKEKVLLHGNQLG